MSERIAGPASVSETNCAETGPEKLDGHRQNRVLMKILGE
jgi:hypothetical protein